MKLQTEKIRGKKEWLALVFFFILVFIYYFFFGNYILFFQEQQSLFVYSPDYLHKYFLRPGGPLDLAGNFLTQFYVVRFAGAFILALILSFSGFIFFHICRRLNPGSRLTLIVSLVSPSILMLMQTHYYHLMTHSLGYVFASGFFFLFILAGKPATRYTLTGLFPLFFYISGAYAILTFVMIVIYTILHEKGYSRYLYSLAMLALILVSSFFFKKFLLVQSYRQILFFPFPFINDAVHKTLFWMLSGYMILIPLLCHIAIPAGHRWKNDLILNLVLPSLVFIVLIFLLVIRFNPQDSRVINLEKMVFNEKWNEAIRLQEKKPSRNLIGQYFYNVALSETNQLCDRLFHGPQDFGTESLILKWSNEDIEWGSFAFYAAGLINEAQRWAYEEMVVYGARPQNMKMLVKTSLLNGNYLLAKKYTGILDRTLFYRKWARKYSMMAEDTSLVRSDSDLGDRLNALPGNDFFIYLDYPESNLPKLVDQNPKNHRAFEYMMSWLMLEKEVEILTNNIRLMKGMGYTRIPVHIEEAILLFYNSTGKLPDMGGLAISNETLVRFNEYSAAFMAARHDPATLQEKMKKFDNTYWYYYHFI